MKTTQLLSSLSLFLLPFLAGAQTNTFPASGNVGIGTISPRTTLDLSNTGAITLKEIRFVADDVGWGGENSDYYTLRKIHDGYNISHLELLLRDDADESFRIYGNDLVHTFDAIGNVYHSGNVGIGTTTPTERLTVNGTMSASGHAAFNNNLFVRGASQNAAIALHYTNGILRSGKDQNGNGVDAIQLNNLGLGVSVHPGGQVGIGTTTPGSYKLAVEGKVGARKVVVTQTNPWPDYVFAPTYKLPTLQEVEAFIKQHKHLPDVPSAKEVETQGLDLGDNQAVLLKKIEELTLYVIEQNKHIEKLLKEKETIAAQAAKVAALEKEMQALKASFKQTSIQ